MTFPHTLQLLVVGPVALITAPGFEASKEGSLQNFLFTSLEFFALFLSF